jgi:hypothetical protein
LRFALDARKQFDAWVPIAITLAELPSRYVLLALPPAPDFASFLRSVIFRTG